jgi:hypothetical protein
LLDANLFGDLHGRNSLTRRDKQVHGIEPFVQGNMAALENGPSANREVKLALIATVEASLTGRDAILTGTSWAGDAFRPETALKVGSGRFFIGEHLKQFEGADSRTAHCRRLSGGLRTARGYQPHAPLTVDAAQRRLILGPFRSHVLAVPSAAIALECRRGGENRVSHKPASVANLRCESAGLAVFFEPYVLGVVRLAFVEIAVESEILIKLAAVNCEGLHFCSP